jgi:hypothetical protein
MATWSKIYSQSPQRHYLTYSYKKDKSAANTKKGERNNLSLNTKEMEQLYIRCALTKHMFIIVALF